MVKILADSTCDLSPELIAQYGIGIIPLYVHLGEEEFRDGVDITPEQLYKWSDEHNTTPKTAAPGIEDIEALLDKEGSDEYVIFTISSSMSSSYTNCTLAADDLEITDRVFVIDSQNLSTGIALLVLKAAQMAAQGRSGSEIAPYGPSEIHACRRHHARRAAFGSAARQVRRDQPYGILHP